MAKPKLRSIKTALEGDAPAPQEITAPSVPLVPGHVYLAKLQLTDPTEVAFGNVGVVQSKLQAIGFSPVTVWELGNVPGDFPDRAAYITGATFFASGTWSGPAQTLALPTQIKRVWLASSAAPPAAPFPAAPSPFTGPLPAALDLAALRTLAASAGFPDVNLAAAVAMAESGGDPGARGDPRTPTDGTTAPPSTSFGLWQIHLPDHPDVDPVRVLDPAYNAAQALRISKGGTDWSPWSTFNKGLYAQYMPGGAKPVKHAGLAGLLDNPIVVAGLLWILYKRKGKLF